MENFEGRDRKVCEVVPYYTTNVDLVYLMFSKSVETNMDSLVTNVSSGFIHLPVSSACWIFFELACNYNF